MHWIVIGILIATVPPLSQEQVLRLDTAADGYDVREEAFFALIENVRLWKQPPGDELVRLQPDFDAMLAEPERFRGDLCLVEGRLVQRATLETPYDAAQEWFLRDESGRPIAAYIAGHDEQSLRDFQEGAHVRIYARFYKRMGETARDGERRDYPAFVGAHPQLVRASTGTLGIVLAPLLILLGVFAFLLVYVRGQRHRSGGRPHRIALGADHLVSEPDDLPEDPADALAELRRRCDPSKVEPGQ